MNDLLTVLIEIFLNPTNLLLSLILAVITVAIFFAFFRDTLQVSVKLLRTFAKAHENCEFEATAGGRIKDYFDADRLLMGSPDVLEEVAGQIVKVLKKYPEAKVVFVEKDSGPVGMLFMEGLVASKLGRPTSIVRPRRDIWKMAVKGAGIGKGDEIVLIQDVLRSGYQVIQANRILEKLGARVIAVVTLVDREEEKDNDFARKNIDVIAITKLSEIEDYKKAA